MKLAFQPPDLDGGPADLGQSEESAASEDPMDDQLYYAIGFVLTGGAVLALLLTWLLEGRDRKRAEQRARNGDQPWNP